jgi:vacuolar-type H+-ATPase subunit I/STV1
MRLIANKPCSFGGKKFYIGNEIPENLVADARLQEKMGVITIVNDNMGVADKQSATLFTQEQVDKMLAEAIEEAVNNTITEMKQKQKELQEALQQSAAERKEVDSEILMETVIIDIVIDSDGENEQHMTVWAKSEEIQQVFSIMQLNADEGAKAIADVKSENVLILLHAADSRKTVKNAAKEQADKLFSIKAASSESISSNEATGTNTEGVDT